MENNTKEQIQDAKYIRARKRIDEIKKFYKHLMIYIVVNLFISFFKVRDYIEDGDTFLESLTRFDTYIVWVVWGFFVLLQAIRTFNANMFLGSDWEERKIKEYMNEK